MTNDDEAVGGITIPPKIDKVIYEKPLFKDKIAKKAAGASCKLRYVGSSTFYGTGCKLTNWAGGK